MARAVEADCAVSGRACTRVCGPTGQLQLLLPSTHTNATKDTRLISHDPVATRQIVFLPSHPADARAREHDVEFSTRDAGYGGLYMQVPNFKRTCHCTSTC
eukprot:355515-Chlamydomonas_euryale.AAC.4